MPISITAKSTGDKTGEILVYGEITDYKWADEDVTPTEFDKSLKNLGDIKFLRIRINSYGGSVFAGQAIVAMLDQKRVSGCKIETVIDGIAASMASVIAQAGETVVMSEGALMMIHKPSARVWGNADEMRKKIEFLEKVEESMVSVYMRRYNSTEENLKSLLQNETWMTAEEAMECGLCTSIRENVKIAACAKGYCIGGINFSGSALAGAEEKIKITEQGDGKNMFNETDISKINAFFDSGKAVEIQKLENGFSISEKQNATAYLTESQLKDAAGTEVKAEVVIEAIKALGDFKIPLASVKENLENLNDQKPNAALVEKANEYDRIREQAVAEALKNAVRAKGDRYDDNRERKILNALSFDEILAQSEDWKAEGNFELNAGKRFSRDGSQEGGNPRLNIEDFKI